METPVGDKAEVLSRVQVETMGYGKARPVESGEEEGNTTGQGKGGVNDECHS